MKRFFAASALAVLAIASPAAAAPKVPTAAELFREPVLSSVRISPDGKHIAAVTSPDGKKKYISVWRTDGLNKPPTIIGSTVMEIENVRFIKNDRLLVSTSRPFVYNATKTYINKNYITDLAGKDWSAVLPEKSAARQSEEDQFVAAVSNAGLLNDLPLDRDNILIVSSARGTNGNIYLRNVYTGALQLVQQGSDKWQYQSDDRGELRVRYNVDFDNGAVYRGTWLKHPDTGEWQEHFRTYARDREGENVVGFTPDKHIVYVRSNREADKGVIKEYDIRARKFLETAFQHKLFEAGGALTSQHSSDFGQPIGFSYQGPEGNEVYWVDPRLDALDKSLDAAMGVKKASADWIDTASGQRAKVQYADGADAYISALSDDRKTGIIVKAGSSQPTEYFLWREGQTVVPIGRAEPYLVNAALGQAKLVQYKARDGLMIPAILTLPDKSVYGDGPYPTIINPHGGPWGRDGLLGDPWQRFFSSQGYAVLQPQFRGSTGWGQKLWRAGDAEWGQKMQDDKDDGARWLIEQKIADPNRIAMHGFSYGGYAAIAAAIRPNGLYQCAIAGAPGEIEEFKRDTRNGRWTREAQNSTARGLNLMANIDKASIPVFVYQGDRDQIVEEKIGRAYGEKLRSAGKPSKYMLVKDMDHGFPDPDHYVQTMTEIQNYLKKDCGPGGL
ncbi:MAG TPA: prolyl oligopeptidase family serine peptidase [Caulobacteraceae bacterium]|jgi:dipeptidyl aminopeptidase/acylaminoacyl peptidase